MKRFYPLLYQGALGLLMLSVLAGAVVVLVIPADQILNRPWSGYTQMVVAHQLNTKEVEALQQIPGVEGVVSAQTTSVSFTTFNGSASVRVEQLDQRLDPADPRFDPYLKAVSRYFNVPDGGALYYIKTKLHPLRLFLSLRRIRLGPDWQIPSLVPAQMILSILFFLIYLGVFIFLKKTEGMNWLLLLFMLPWFFRLCAGDSLDLLGFVLTTPIFLAFLEFALLFVQNRSGEIQRETGIKRRLLVLGIVFCLLQIILIAADPPRLSKQILTLGTALLLFPLIYVRFRVMRLKRAHDVFGPVPILRRLKPKTLWYRRSNNLSLILLALALLSLPLTAALKKSNPSRFPIPQPLGQPISWTTLAGQTLSGPRWLPNLDDFLTHKAYQEGLVFGRDYRFPFPGERIYISHYLKSRDGKIVKTHRVIKRYQASWVQESLSGWPVGTLQRLLVDQNQLVEIAWLSDLEFFLRQLFWLKIVLVCIFLISFVILGDFHLTPMLLYGTRIFVLRRYTL